MNKALKIDLLICKAKRAYALFAFIFFISNSKAQISTNLVSNNSFEQFVNCPSGYGELTKCNFWFPSTINSTVDFYHPCSSSTLVGVPQNAAGKRFAQHGNSYIGFAAYLQATEGRECAETSLKQTLKPTKNYCVTFYVSLAEYSKYAIANISAYFTADSLKNYYPIVPPVNYFFTPHVESNTLVPISDTINWVKVQGVHVANGTENFITIGNFRNDASTNVQQIKPLNPSAAYNISYYYLDNTSVVEINPAKAAVKDTILVCANATYTLGTDSTWDASYQWQPTTGLSCTNCPNPILTVTNNIKYVLTKQQCSATTKDSVVFKIYNTPVTILPLSDATVCAGNTVTLSTDSNSFFNYTWQPTLGLSCTNCPMPIASPVTPISYTLTKSACGFSNTANVTISIKPNFTLTPQIILTNTINCLFDTLKFSVLNFPNGNDVNYNWQPQNSFVSTFTNTTKALVQNNSYYYVTINNSNNGIYCPFIKKDSIYIALQDTCIKPLIIPTIFTPNYDNVNDVWKFTMPYGTKLNAVYVYNRWGALIYSIDETTLNADNSKIKVVRWDGHTTSGEECSDGVYFYIVSVTENGEKKIFKGNVTLIR